MKKLGLAIGVVLLLGGVAWAYTSATFKTQADAYVTNTCGNTPLLNSQAAICYSVLKAEELDASLATANASISSLTTTVNGHTASISNLQTQVDAIKALWLEDSIGAKLGLVYPLVFSQAGGSIESFYSPSLNVMVSFDPVTGYISRDSSVGYNEIWFSSSDCSGQAYVPHNSATDIELKPLWVAGVGKYYVIPITNSPASISHNSKLTAGFGSTPSCSTISGTGSATAANVVSLPFSDPVSLPTKLHYTQ